MKKWQQMVPNIERKYPKLVEHKSLKGDKEKIGIGLICFFSSHNIVPFISSTNLKCDEI